MKLVVDASAYLEYLVRGVRAESVEAMIRGADAEMHAPSFCDVELASALARLLRRRAASDAQAAAALSAYLDLPVIRHGSRPLLQRAIDLRNNFSTYDAIYVALAEELNATLVTVDARLARAARQHLDIEVAP